jgi:D-serine deaminase-like pyridoxal phosphate-dependent protein
MRGNAREFRVSEPCQKLALDGVDTPALLLDLDALDANIARIAQACRDAGVSWRPHVKGIKVPEIAHRLIAAGAIGVTCAKLGEAEVMAEAGISDILIANQIVGPIKISRLMELRRRCDVIVAVDHVDNVSELASAARSAGVRLRVLIEVDIGIHRAGVLPGQPVLLLASQIAQSGSLEFSGVMGWEGHAAPMLDPKQKANAVSAAVSELSASAQLCRQAGLNAKIVSCGGTGTYWLSVTQAGVTEVQAGGGVFCDMHYRNNYGVPHPFALTLLTTVTSRPTPHRIVCDAGKKAMSGDAALPSPLGLGPTRLVRLSAEHITVELDQPSDLPRVGSRLEFVIGYSDTTVHLHNVMHVKRGNRIEYVWPVLGRGKLQ